MLQAFIASFTQRQSELFYITLFSLSVFFCTGVRIPINPSIREPIKKVWSSNFKLFCYGLNKPPGSRALEIFLLSILQCINPLVCYCADSHSLQEIKKYENNIKWERIDNYHNVLMNGGNMQQSWEQKLLWFCIAQNCE